MSESAQPYVTENPDVREPDVEREELQGSGSVPVYDADPTRLDLSTEYPETSVRVTLDEVVGPDHPAAVIVPPEGRGEHPQLWGVTDKSPLRALDEGEGDEVTAVVDGEVVSGDEAAKREQELRERSSS
jgi:hypothetical protein